MERMRLQWSGPGVVGAGVSTLFFNDSMADPAEVRTWLESIKGFIPDDVQITVPNGGDVMNPVSGAITGTWSGLGGGITNGTSSSSFLIGTGVRIVWDTAGIRNGRHVRGATYLVPVGANVFDTTGRIVSATQQNLKTAAENLMIALAGGLVVWSRPKGFPNGQVSAVTGVTVTENPTTLRSRRV
jgi:hypothetical protein